MKKFLNSYAFAMMIGLFLIITIGFALPIWLIWYLCTHITSILTTLNTYSIAIYNFSHSLLGNYLPSSIINLFDIMVALLAIIVLSVILAITTSLFTNENSTKNLKNKNR